MATERFPIFFMKPLKMHNENQDLSFMTISNAWDSWIIYVQLHETHRRWQSAQNVPAYLMNFYTQRRLRHFSTDGSEGWGWPGIAKGHVY